MQRETSATTFYMSQHLNLPSLQWVHVSTRVKTVARFQTNHLQKGRLVHPALTWQLGIRLETIASRLDTLLPSQSWGLWMCTVSWRRTWT